MASLHIHPYPPMRLAGFLSEAHTPGANTRSTSLYVTPLVLADASQSAARHFTAVKGRRESSATHTSCPCCTQRASLCRRAVPPRRLPRPQGRARRVLKGGTVHITMVFTRGELGGPSCSGAERARSPSHTRRALCCMNPSALVALAPHTRAIRADRCRAEPDRSWD
jgi:hypothetical protein